MLVLCISKKVKTFLLDVNCTYEDIEEIATALLHSIKQVYSPDAVVFIYVQCTDSGGGGGTKDALYFSLKSRRATALHYLISTCSLHNLQTCLRNAVVNLLGEGGMNEKNEPVLNVMQMLHGHTIFKIGKKTKN